MAWKNIILQEEVHKELAVFKANNGYKSFGETISALIREHKEAV